MFIVTDTSIRPEGERPSKIGPVSGFLGNRDPLLDLTKTQEQMCTASRCRHFLWSTKDADKCPDHDPWQKYLSRVHRGFLIYQEIPVNIGFSTYDTAVTAWKNAGGVSAQKYVLESFWLESNQNSRIGNRSDNFSVRLMGYVRPSISGDYTFYAVDDDACALRVADSKGYLASWSASYRTFFTLRLLASTWYEFDFLFQQGGGGKFYNVGWTGPGISSVERIPVRNLGYKKSQTAPDFTY